MDPRYAEVLLAYVAENGIPVLFSGPGNQWPDRRVSPYGWQDYDAREHIREDKCGWITDDEVDIEEVMYSEFDGTDVDNLHVMGVNASPARCRCGKYRDVTLRVEASLSDTIKFVANWTPTNEQS